MSEGRKAKTSMNTLVVNIGQLVTYDPGTDRVEKYDHAALEVLEGEVSLLYSGEDAPFSRDYDRTIDARGRLVTPGLIDAHTHPVFARIRSEELAMKTQGLTYQEISERGGGIRQSVKHLREISESELTSRVRGRLLRSLAYGTTTLEAKSGYGLDIDSEMKSLRALAELNDEIPMTIVPTFLGAHVIPEEYLEDREGYIRLLCEEMIPAIAQEELAVYCDVFCEEGIFSSEEAEIILRAGRAEGLDSRIHTNEFASIGGVEVATKLEVASADHLAVMSEEEIDQVANSTVVPVLLPGTTFFLGSEQYAPARALLDRNALVALATDFNPGSSPTWNLQMIASLGCIKMHMTPEEVLQAITINPAISMDLEESKGALVPGFDGDFILWNAHRWEEIPSQFGVNHCYRAFINGVPVDADVDVG